MARKVSEESPNSLIGTEEYVAPEILRNQDVTYSTDIWSLGVMLYLFLVGKTPFKGVSECQTFQNILSKEELSIPDAVPQVAQDLIRKMLLKDPEQRLGAQDLKELMQHPFFEGMDFE